MGLTIGAGSATAQQFGSQLNITVGQTAILNWQSFNIGAGETTSFLQPSANSVVFNVIDGQSPSQIFGKLNANGTVILANANGFYFGPNSMIKVGGSFIATTAPLAPDLGSGAGWQFTGMPPLASIVNYGQISVGTGRSLFLIAEKIENDGRLNAPGGNVDLAAGQSVLVSESADGRGLSAAVTLPSGSVDNFGRVTADGGTIVMQAKVVNQNGILQADSIAEKNGVIELVASDQLNLGADSQILARGDASAGGSAGGTVTLKSENIFSDAAGSQIVTTGGANGGNGGNIEVSAPNIQSLNSAMDASAQNDFRAGEFLLDPVNIVLGTSGSGTVPANGTVGYNSSGTLNLNVNSAFLNKHFSQILLQASGNISLSAGLNWNLSTSTGLTAGQLTLEAGGDIIFGSKSIITDANAWSVSLYAGYNFNTGAVQSGVGNIYMNGGSGLATAGTIELSAGNINLYAGQSILLASQKNHASSIVSGSVFTTGGGSIFADALAGNIDAGTSNGGSSSTSQAGDYYFNNSGAHPNTFLGGISTAAGGNVTLIAGNNIDSTPVVASGKWPGTSGTYAAGDVTIIAGNQINGNYTLANGVGTLLAGVPVSLAQAAVLQNPDASPTAYAATLASLETAVTQARNPGGNIGGVEYSGGPNLGVTLSLITGSWNAWAANNILLKEVNNPNGTFNSLQSYLYNYAPTAAANFWAGNAIELAGGTVGGNLARVAGGNQNIIYAPSLSLNAGAGGIQIDSSIILAPSSAGSLNIVTRAGGNLSGTAGATTLTGITMSDSGSTDYNTFATGHAATPLHLNDPNPVTLNISGSIESFSLTVPTFATINVQGNTYNFGVIGQNLSAAQTTAINVAGNITYRGDLTTQPLVDALGNPALISSTLFNSIIAGNPALAGLLRYDATAGTLSFVGVMDSATEAALSNPMDINGNALFTSAQLTAWQNNISQLFAASQTATLGDQGLAIAGPGSFNISAHSIDLGISGGISVLPPDAALTAISISGANISVTTVGNLEMTSSKIANESYLGGISLNIGGTLDVGGQLTTFGDPSSPKGIFTTSGGNLSVTASGAVNVDSSRIAAYDGGNIFIESLHGDVNAGTGAAGYVSMNSLELDPLTGQLVNLPATMPGSGILATTLFGGSAQLGNITIKAPEGSVNASLGGVLQISFDGADTQNNFVQVNAGKDINASGSGIIGSNIRLTAGGNINGVVVGSQSVNIDSQHNVDVTAVSGGNVNINASGTVSGTIVGGGDVSVSGDAIDAAVRGGSVSASGDTAGANIGVPQSNVAKENAEVADNASTTTSKAESSDDEELNKKKKGIALAQKVSRVTVLLPQKN
jgi:filamentous hemagglutinin family protein